MTIQIDTMIQSSELLKKLGLTHTEAIIYLSMCEGRTKVKDIVDVTGIKRPSVYYAISQLEKRGLIGRLQVGEYNQWKVHSFDSLKEIVEEKRSEVASLEGEVDMFVANAKKAVQDTDNTKVTYYDGKKTIESIVFNSLYCKDKHINSIAPENNFFFQAGQEFATKYVEERKRRGISTRNLWEELLEPKILQRSYKNTSEVRLLPKTMKGKFRTTVFIYDDKVMYIAPLESNYAVVFQSKEHHAMLSAIFDTLWSASKTAFK